MQTKKQTSTSEVSGNVKVLQEQIPTSEVSGKVKVSDDVIGGAIGGVVGIIVLCCLFTAYAKRHKKERSAGSEREGVCQVTVVENDPEVGIFRCVARSSFGYYEVDLNSFELKPYDQMIEPIQTWIRGSIFKKGGCRCPGSIVRNAVVTSVLKIKNGKLQEQYRRKWQIMKAQLADHGSEVGKLAKITNQPDGSSFPNLDQEINELFLFHGTSTDKTGRTIAEEGFDVRVADLKGMYGAGSYFADCSCKSNQYTGSGKIRTFLICRVLMGCPFFTKKTHNDPACPTRLPPKNSNGRSYDSIFAQSGVVNDGSQMYNEYVVFSEGQVYSDFLVHFQMHP